MRETNSNTSYKTDTADDLGNVSVHEPNRAQDEAWGRTIGELDWLAEAALRGEA